MSEKNTEMVMIEVPARWAEWRIKTSDSPANIKDTVAVTRSCEAALAARKTKLERWREEVPGGISQHSNCHPTPNQARLMAAAPQLLDAALWTLSGSEQEILALPMHTIKKAIRAALPPEVAAEVLGDE